jgi:hypothetical protein
MQCMVCGVEMRLVKVERAETMMVAGYEFRTFACSSCHDVERRLTFSREPTPQLDQLVSVDSTKAAVPPSQDRDNAPLPASADHAGAARSALDQDEAAPSVSPASTDQDEAALSVAPAITDQVEPAPSVSPASTDQDEAALSVSPTSTDQTEPASSVCAPSTDEAVPPSRWARAIAKLRKRQIKNL